MRLCSRFFIAVALTLGIVSGALAWADGIHNPSSNSVGDFQGIDSNKASGVVAFTTFDPSNKGTSQTLSNGNLTVVGNGTDGIVRSIANHTTGKYYAEFTTANAANSAVGVVNATQTLNTFIGSGANSMAAGFGGGWVGGGAGGTTTAPNVQISGHTYGVAIDVDNKAAWIIDITAAGNWNANVSANPATNTNGATFTFTGAVYLGAEAGGNLDHLTFDFGATAYSGSAPAGFGNW